ncbi:hypothetical protein [Bradyrhizobium erythrophlei]|uniref:Uncharacterized protein n=1 Tax=Bradyrhizobium erythrophlei TaxID=1437360 RepID=A0A1M5XXG8_9BRAD|nr:hypothetical protein [Bradyrhizobium erythrophlei]SHI04238.1 hypothetical protein SAMN05443248_7689 [Bradyrhizobium erythrophlei]
MEDSTMREPVNPHILLERTHEPDCRFVAAWLIKVAEAQEFWSEALTDPEFSDQIGLIHVMATPHLAAFGLEILGELERSRHVAALGLYSDEIGLFCSELTLLVRLGFFVCAGTSYHMTVPDTITLAKVKQAALDSYQRQRMRAMASRYFCRSACCILCLKRKLRHGDLD